ncbi:coiled-coil domain-containing protein [Kitasatospora griseola]|uniref:hypothetical protein n=1 Tax=Kitasatospora griseola TaxID=2064 RepID=UPI0037F20089
METARIDAEQLLGQARRELADARDRSADLLGLAELATADADARTRAADDQAEQILAAARQQAESILAGAEQDARALREQGAAAADAEAEKLLADARGRAEKLLADARAQADRVRAEAEHEADRLLADVTEQARQAAAALTAEVETAAGRRAEQIVAEAVEEAERTVEAAEVEARQIRRVSASELTTAREQLADATEALERTRARVDAYQDDAERELAGRRALADQACRDALAAADKARADAADDAQRIRDTAAARARELAEATEAQAEDLRAQAEELRARLEEAARADADEIREAAQAEAGRLIEQAEAEAEQVREDAAVQAAGLRERGQQHADTLRSAAESRIAELERQAKAARGKAEAEAQRITTQARIEAETAIKEAAGQVVEAEWRVRALLEQEERLAAKQAARKRGLAARARRRAIQLTAWAWTKAPWAALAAGVGLTASGEYALAVLVGIPEEIGWLLPVAIDVWAMSAIRARRGKEVVAALATMIAANVAYHLAEAHIVGMKQWADGQWHVQWGLIVAVACIAPIVVWRVHALIPHAPETHDADTAPAGEPSATLPHGPETGTATIPAEPAREPVPTAAPALVARPAALDETAGGASRATGGAATRLALAAGETERNATPRAGATRGSAATPAAATGSAGATTVTVARVLTETDIEVIARHVKRHQGPSEKLPLQPIADELGVSKSTASRRVAAFRDLARVS